MCFANCRVVTKISSCQVNTAIRRGIKQLGVSVGFIFLLFSFESSREAMFVVAGGNPRPPPINDTPVIGY